MWRAITRAGVACGVLVLLVACEPDGVVIEFEPAIGDVHEFESTMTITATRRIGDDTETDRRIDGLHATETITRVDGGILADVIVRRDGARDRTFTVALDRFDRLAGIDLVDGVSAAGVIVTGAEGVGVNPPEGPLQPGRVWPIGPTNLGDGNLVAGEGRVRRLGHEDGRDVAAVTTELRFDVLRTVETPDGRVTLSGRQTAVSTTTVAVDDGVTVRDHTVVTADLEVLVEPPQGTPSAPITGALTYEIVIETARVRG